MSRNLLIIGCLLMPVGLGFVLPQLAILRIQGHLVAGQITLLFFGLLVSLGGLASAAFCLKRMRTRT